MKICKYCGKDHNELQIRLDKILTKALKAENCGGHINFILCCIDALEYVKRTIKTEKIEDYFDMDLINQTSK